MLFNSYQFLIFFPLVTGAYFLLGPAGRRVLLLIASCVFYMAFIPAYVLILFAIILADYFAAFWIARAAPRGRRLALAVSLAANVGLLAVFKYYPFIREQSALAMRALGWSELPLPGSEWLLPIGLSFHTFQAMSYTIEVYRGRVAPERNLLTYALYVMFYPQLVAGPIERPQHLLPQLSCTQPFDYGRVVAGLRLMAWGLFKKVVIADRIAIYVTAVYGAPEAYQGLPLLLATYLFAMQIYCDFSGYSDIAIGAARVMGIDLMQNFNRPYAARSIPEFWRRWHISLSTWFRDYVYIPLGGNRLPAGRHVALLLLVFAISGFWHGAAWGFVAWGVLHGLYMVASMATRTLRGRVAAAIGLPDAHPLRRALQTVVTFHLVAFAWIFFRADSFEDAFYIATHLVRAWSSSASTATT